VFDAYTFHALGVFALIASAKALKLPTLLLRNSPNVIMNFRTGLMVLLALPAFADEVNQITQPLCIPSLHLLPAGFASSRQLPTLRL
jgi:hypothetical protein